jgi:drug/metabolite transporter (DMT)-like permease
MNAVGIAAGLATAALWTATAVCFEAAARRIGSLAVNLLRLFVAGVFFVGLSMFRTGQVGPAQLSGSAWRDLALSGFVGFAVADWMLFRACVVMGARLTMLIYASVPAMTGIAAYFFLGERISMRGMCGMAITSAGICLAVIGKRRVPKDERPPSRKGILLALGASAGQAAGLLLGKSGAGNMDPFSATELRVFAGIVGLFSIALLSRQLPQIGSLLRTAVGLNTGSDRHSLKAIRTALLVLALGAFLGPFLGVSLGLLSTQLLSAGIASTLMSLVPALLIPVSALVFRERVTVIEVTGTVMTLVGVALLV